MSQVRKSGTAKANTTGTVLKVLGSFSSGVSSLAFWAKSGPLLIPMVQVNAKKLFSFLNGWGKKRTPCATQKKLHEISCLDVYK